MLAWGVKVDEYGNAVLDENKELIKEEGKGLSEELWQEMVAYAKEKGWAPKNYKWLNLPFEMKFLSEPREIRERMTKAVEEFTYDLLVNVFNAQDTADIAKELLLEAGSANLGPKATQIENPADWTVEKIKTMENLRTHAGDGDYDD